MFERDEARPWIIVASHAETVELEEGDDFYRWAAERWPQPRWTFELDPGQETRWGLVGYP